MSHESDLNELTEMSQRHELSMSAVMEDYFRCYAETYSDAAAMQKMRIIYGDVR